MYAVEECFHNYYCIMYYDKWCILGDFVHYTWRLALSCPASQFTQGTWQCFRHNTIIKLCVALAGFENRWLLQLLLMYLHGILLLMST